MLKIRMKINFEEFEEIPNNQKKPVLKNESLNSMIKMKIQWETKKQVIQKSKTRTYISRRREKSRNRSKSATVQNACRPRRASSEMYKRICVMGKNNPFLIGKWSVNICSCTYIYVNMLYIYSFNNV